MSEAERAPNGGKQGSLKQSEGHWKEDVRDRWAELMLEDAEYDDHSLDFVSSDFSTRLGIRRGPIDRFSADYYFYDHFRLCSAKQSG